MTDTEPTGPPPPETPPKRGAGRPQTIARRQRWSYFADAETHERAAARAKEEGLTLSEVVRRLEAKYAAGKVSA